MDIPTDTEKSVVEQGDAPSDGSKASGDLSQRIEALTSLSSDALRVEWRRLYRGQPPRLSRDLLIRALAYRIQELAYGGLSKATRRRLERFAEQLQADGHVSLDREHKLRPGQRLIREWHGKTYTVTVLDQGFFYNGNTYSSLTAIAVLVSGAHWSGPRFFGLVRGRPKVGAKHVEHTAMAEEGDHGEAL